MTPLLNDLTKDAARRFLAAFGFRIQKSNYLPFSYSRKNYPKHAPDTFPVIFDVGANIGQSAIWYAKEFPESRIHAFEPFAVVYNKLIEATRSCPQIVANHMAIGAMSGELELPAVSDPFCQTGSLSSTAVGGALEKVRVDKIDNYCTEKNISQILILKTDTEGHDLDVLAGAERMLKEGRIASILSEATIQPEDGDHTNLWEIQKILAPYNFTLRSIFDLHHTGSNGRLCYFNALFIKD